MAAILIVDDDHDSRDTLCQFLLRSGYEVECASNGREALSSILGRLPDLVILDLFMPEMDGGGLLEVLRSYLRLQSLPVVVLTGLPDSPMVERARHLKVNAILVKGKATFEDILRAVQEELPRAPK
jgi:CheY-like chemotaxis protein